MQGVGLCSEDTGASDLLHKTLAPEKSLRPLASINPPNEVIASGPTQHKKASNHQANLPLEMYSFTL